LQQKLSRSSLLSEYGDMEVLMGTIPYAEAFGIESARPSIQRFVGKYDLQSCQLSHYYIYHW
jgi:hypothetical protein